MFITHLETPNPNTLKFLPGEKLLTKGSINFNKNDKIINSPLARSIIGIEGIINVLIGTDYIAVTKEHFYSWEDIKANILTTIMDHFVAKIPLLDIEISQAATVEHESIDMDEDLSAKEKEVVAEIKELLDTKIRPSVAQDGGDIIYRKFKNGIVFLELYGACSGCPSAKITLKNGIENLLKYYIPEVEAVEEFVINEI